MSEIGIYPLAPREDLNFDEATLRRIELTISCRDTDHLPKVAGAGSVQELDGVRTQLMHDGTRVIAGGYHGEWMIEVIRRLGGHHEPQEELVVHHIIERLRASPGAAPQVIMELGAFWSYYSIWAMRALGCGGILVEPDPRNLAIGQQNMALNGLEAGFVNAAVGGEHGSSIRLVCESDLIERELPVVTVPALMEHAGIPRLEALFVDVQGPELTVLEQAATLLKTRAIRFVVVSTHHHSISNDPATHQRCLALLQDLGVHIIAEHTVGESFSGDGLIAGATFRADQDLSVKISHARYRDSMFGELEPELAAAWRQLGRGA